MSHADDSNFVKKPSVGAFLFMPQFSLCFRGFSHIYPVFMRCLAAVLAEARLISKAHPALNYGARGIEKTHILDLFGAAWFNLRVRRSNTEQWGMFTAVVLMVSMLLVAIGSFTMHVFFGIGSVVQAQLFLPNVFEHPVDPYGQGAQITNIAQGPGNITATVAPLFDARVSDNATSATGISTDYALMLLDKILRQSMTGPIGTGGVLQNAMTGLMLTYNTGMTLIAGTITLWMVMSMVLATARAGSFGGGRHNMVWAPIRMIFALGLILPLGAQGYSSGQYMVMKLAEWGSNLGTQGWVAYVNGVVGDQTLLAPFSLNNATSIVAGLNKILVCQMAFNTILYETTSGLDPQQVIRVRQGRSRRDGKIFNRYTNDTGSNICGTITYGDPNATEDLSVFLAGPTAAVNTPMDGPSALAAAGPGRTLNTNYDAALATALDTFRNTMLASLAAELDEPMDLIPDRLGSGARVPAAGQTIVLGRQLACQIVARAFIKDPATLPNPVGALPAPYDYCGAGYAAPAAAPDATIPEQQIARIMDRHRCVFDGSAPIKPLTSPPCGLAPGAKGALMTYITGGGLVAEMQSRGWAGMGMWYQKIAALNAVIQGARELPATVEPGTLWEGASKDSWWNKLKCAGSWLIAKPCKSPEIEEQASAALGEYDAWWAIASNPGEASTVPNGTEATEERNYSILPSAGSGGGVGSILGALKNAVTKGSGTLLNWVLARIWPRPDNFFLFSAVDVAATNTYPMATLVDAGHKIIYTALTALGGLTILQVLSSGSIATVSGGIGFAVSSLANMISTMAMAMLIAGCTVSFYLPVLPLLRVAFAVMTWMVSVFEAVVMLPMAALTHLSTEGEGLGSASRAAWVLWLNVLMRPIFVVFGFVGGMLIFNTFAIYFHTTFSQGGSAMLGASVNPFTLFLGQIAYSVIYLGVLYTAANTSFKLLDIMPDHMMRWMGAGISADPSMDDNSDGKMLAAATVMKDAQPRFQAKENEAKTEKPGSENSSGGGGNPPSGGGGGGKPPSGGGGGTKSSS